MPILARGENCDPDVCSMNGRCADGLSCFSLIAGQQGRCTDLGLALLSQCSTSPGTDYCAAGTYCTDIACTNDIRRCANPAGAGDQCDGDMQKPRPTKACFPCGPGLTCVGATGGKNGVCQQKCADDTQCACVPGSTGTLTCTAGKMTSPAFGGAGRCTTCKSLHDSCSIATPCCDGSLCGSAGQCCIGDVPGHVFAQNSVDCCPGFYGTPAVVIGQGPGYICNRCKNKGESCASGTDQECCGSRGLGCDTADHVCKVPCAAGGACLTNATDQCPSLKGTFACSNGRFGQPVCVANPNSSCGSPPPPTGVLHLAGFEFNNIPGSGWGIGSSAGSYDPNYDVRLPAGSPVGLGETDEAYVAMQSPTAIEALDVSVASPSFAALAASATIGVPYTFEAYVAPGGASQGASFWSVNGEFGQASWYEIVNGAVPSGRAHTVKFRNPSDSLPVAEAARLLAVNPFFGIADDYSALVATHAKLLRVEFYTGKVVGYRDLVPATGTPRVPLALDHAYDQYFVAYDDLSIERVNNNAGLTVARSGHTDYPVVALAGGLSVPPPGNTVLLDDTLVVLENQGGSQPTLLVSYPAGNVSQLNPTKKAFTGTPVGLRVMLVNIAVPQVQVTLAWVITKNPNQILLLNVSDGFTPLATKNLGTREPLMLSYGSQANGAIPADAGVPDSGAGDSLVNEVAEQGAQTGMVNVILRDN